MIRIFFGNPGCGKTTTACKMLKKNRRDYDYLYSNFPTTHNISHEVSLADLGTWTFPPNSYVVVDEAGIEYNNRKYKTLSQSTIRWFKLHRHFRCDCDIISQSWEDMDITIRRLADQLWYMRKIGPFTLIRRCYKSIMVDEHSHQIVDGYRLAKGIWLVLQPLRLIGLSFIFPQLKTSWKLCFRPFYYRYFNSWDVPKDVPVRHVYDRKQRHSVNILQRIKTLLVDQPFLRRKQMAKEDDKLDPPQDSGV